MTSSARCVPKLAVAASLALSLWSLQTWAGESKDKPRPPPARNVLVTAGSSTMVVDSKGSVWIWGAGRGSERGTFPEREMLSPTPERMQGLPGVVSLATGDHSVHTLALLEDGTVLSWGSNFSGQLGDGTTNPRPTRAPVVGLTDVVSVAVGGSSSLAVRGDGTVWAWGKNRCGETGGPPDEWTVVTPTQVQGLSDVVSIFADRDLSAAVRQDGSLWVWGCTEDGSTAHQLRQVPGLTQITRLAMSRFGLAAVRSDGTVWEWFVRDLPAGTPAQQLAGYTGAVDVAYSFYTLQVLRSDGTVWNQGENFAGERGFPSEALSPPGPSQVPGLTGVVSLASEMYQQTVHALRADGTAVGWGLNTYGMLGGGISPLQLELVQVPLPCHLKMQGLEAEGSHECSPEH